jgi:triosephosphate isomerase
MSQANSSAAGKTGRGLFLAGNWKMYKTPDEARDLALQILQGAPRDAARQVALFPPAICLPAVVAAVRGATPEIIVGAQNMHFEKEGAFTGEISAEMILAAGGTAVILGHSERRHVFGESDEFVARKVRRALEAGLLPILCVGEKIEEREAGETTQVVSRQLGAVMEVVPDAAQLQKIIIAYEPVWAIGTGKTATPQQGQEVHRFIREEVGKAFAALGADAGLADGCSILYGGSVKPGNATDLLAEPDIDGVLVGGASLKADSFLGICTAGT